VLRGFDLIIKLEMATLEVLLMPFNAQRVLSAYNALADYSGGLVTNCQEVLIVQVVIKLFIEARPYQLVGTLVCR